MEPIYQYVKGEGWIPCVTQQASRIIIRRSGSYKISVYERPPREGEYAWFVDNPNWTLEDVLTDLGGMRGWRATWDDVELIKRTNRRTVVVERQPLPPAL